MELQRVRRPEGPQDWEVQRAVITDLYITKGLELEDLMKNMEDKHFFQATKKQYKTHFTKWDLRKNVRPFEYSAMIRKRRKREEEGKGSAFRLRGALVDDSKIVRYGKKTKTGDEHEIAEAGTPEDLSCFTPSPVANSPNTPSPDLRHFQSHNLSSTSIVSPSEQTHLVPSPCLFFPESPDYEVRLTYSEFVRPVLGQSPEGRSVTLANDFDKSEFGGRSDGTFQWMGQFVSGLFNCRLGLDGLGYSFFTLLSCLDKYAHKQKVVGSGIWRSRTWRCALSHFLLSLKPYDSFSRVYVSLKRPTPTHSETRIFRLKPSALPRYGPGNARKITVSVGAPLYKIRVKFSCSITSDLEEKLNPRLRRSESCESIRSMDSFLSDSVVDWKELLYGYNQ